MESKDTFLKLFLAHNTHLFSFILTLVPNYSDAEDLLQETASLMWEKFETYRPGSSFWAWARQIARYKVANYYRVKKSQFQLDEDLLEDLGAAHERMVGHLNEQKAALTGCLKKLRQEDLNLIRMKYFQNLSIAEIARQSNRSIHSLYKRISFIYFLLQDCVQKTLAAWDIRYESE